MSPEPTCPDCGAPLPPDAPRGLCPACLMGAALSRTADGSRSRAGVTGAFGPSGSPTIAATGSPAVAATGARAALTETLGDFPRILLRDAETGSGFGPMVQPSSPEMPDPADRAAHLQLLGEIARGGMGAVLKGRDVDLGRDLAVKVLLEAHQERPDLIRRFVEEAQIAGQLQHPGVVPIYELGAFADRRPYFAMKLVRGRTLAELLADRDGPADGLPRFLGILEQVCRTMAYAHARGVVHRDLKPSNVMVGGFGEVQVMDWGLAKVLARGGAADDADAGQEPDREEVVAIARPDHPDAERSRAGSVMGTPAYMAPEQARGEVDRIAERADVFALGSMLCEVLTGSPAFTGRTSGEIHRKAAAGATADALARLDAAGADAELVGLARDCLAVEPDDRPRDARAVSDRLTAYLGGVQERLRAAELARAAEAARAEEAQARVAVERSRRRRTVALAAVLLIATTLGGVAVTYTLQERRARLALADRIGGEVSTLLAEARSRPEDLTLWSAARAPLRQVDTALYPEPARAWLEDLKRQVQAGFDSAQSGRPLLNAFEDARKAVNPAGRRIEADQIYGRAFREAGLDLEAPASDLAAALRARPAAVLAAAVAALDDWAHAWLSDRPSDPRWRRYLEIARAADPDPFRDRVRAATLDHDDLPGREASLRALAADPSAADQPPASSLLLAQALSRLGADDAAADLLRRAAARRPDDFWVDFTLAETLMRLDPPARDEAIGHYRAAHALRPQAGEKLARVLQQSGRAPEASVLLAGVYDRAWKGDWQPLLGICLSQQRRTIPPGVIEMHLGRGREAVRLYPTLPSARTMLGVALLAADRPGEAVEELREAFRLDRDPGSVSRSNLRGIELHDPRPGLGMSPDDPFYHVLGPIRPVVPRALLGVALAEAGDFAGSLTVLREIEDSLWGAISFDFPPLLARIERLARLADRLPAVLRGEEVDGDARDLATLASYALDHERYAAAARLGARAMEADPSLADDWLAFHRYNTACAAVLASSGLGRDDPPPDDAAKARFRAQALGWLRDDLALRVQRNAIVFTASPFSASLGLPYWKLDADLSGVRDPEELARLPRAERDEWRAFWAEVDRLLEEAEKNPQVLRIRPGQPPQIIQPGNPQQIVPR